MNRKILRIAIPSIAQNVTVPLLGLADAAISGHLGGAEYIGAVAVGSMIFNMLYWLCAFLRMSIGGVTAQTYGAQDYEALPPILLRSLRIALAIALSFVLLQVPLEAFSFWLMDATPEVEAHARTYFRILIWGAPAVLSTYCFAGWYLGQQNARFPMTVAIVQNVLNIAFSLFFVLVLGWKVEGVATGTLLAQWAGVAMYGVAPLRAPSPLPQAPLPSPHPEGDKAQTRGEASRYPLYKILANNIFKKGYAPKLNSSPGGGRGEGALFLRTLCMVAVQVWFTKYGAAQGDVLLAVNALLMQYYLLFSYVMDGFAYAGEAVGGSLCGARDRSGFLLLTKRLFLWGLGLTAVFTLVYIVGGAPFLSLLTDDRAVCEAARTYLPYAYLLPACGMATFLFDGLCIGTTSFRLMLLSVFCGGLTFFLLLQCPPLEAAAGSRNDLLWVAMLAFLAVRGLVQALFYHRILPV
ncbi:MAG: MATE family efflux transporter [Alloprevotella sp.]|nr:MATE family efflux transporter [Alloprevotella sp.]